MAFAFGSGAEEGGEQGDGGRGEEVAEGEGGVEGVADAGDDLGGQQGVTAEGEEIVVDSDGVHAQDLAPDAGQQALGGGAGQHGARAAPRRTAPGAGSAARSSLPLGLRGRASRRRKWAGTM